MSRTSFMKGVMTWKHFLHYRPIARGNHPPPDDSPYDMQLMWSFDAFFPLIMDGLMNKQYICLWLYVSHIFFFNNEDIDREENEEVLRYSSCTNWTYPPHQDTAMLKSSVTPHMLYSTRVSFKDIKGDSSEETARGDILVVQEPEVVSLHLVRSQNKISWYLIFSGVHNILNYVMQFGLEIRCRLHIKL